MLREVLVKACREACHEVIAEAENGRIALELIRARQPELVILDIRLPELDGISLAHQVRAESRSTKILVISAYREEYTLFRLQRCGVHGFIDKNTQTLSSIKQAIQAIADDKTWFSPTYAQVTLRRIQDPNSFDKKLTEHEQAILIDIAHGATDNEIAVRYRISLRTVQGHKSTIMRKLNIPSSRGLVAYAHEKGFFDTSRGLAMVS